MTADFHVTPILWSHSLLQIKATQLPQTRQLTFLNLLVLLAFGRGDNFLVETKTTDLNKGFLPLRTTPCRQKWTSWYVWLWRCCWCSPVYCWGYSRARETERENISLAPDYQELLAPGSCAGPDCLCLSVSDLACLLYNLELSEHFVPLQNIFCLNWQQLLLWSLRAE